ncbi:hypothetical protein BD408DRAFT_417139 [Parasitella parasitica]|nr:hypothetical protein BD408DRAFT_417139 [Parasitella parasitica]
MSSTQMMSHPSIVLPRLIGFLGAHISNNPNLPTDHPSQLFEHRISLFFSGLRPSACNQQDSSWSLLFRAMDRIPLDFSSTVISAATSLQIPLASVVLSVSPNTKFRKSFDKLPASIAYTMDPTLDHCLRPKSTQEISSNPNLATSFLRFVRQDQIQLAPFFVRTFIHRRFAGVGRFPFSPVGNHLVVDASPFVQAVFSSLSPTSRVRQHRLCTKSYRKLCSPPSAPPPSLPPPYNPSTRPAWSTFWALPLSHSCRNVWYRFLYHRIPHRVRLYEWERAPSPSCAICHHPTESTDHFMFSCPVKLAVWQQVHHEHLGAEASITSLDLHHLLTTLRSPHVRSTSDLCIIAATLESIWLSHWSFIFNDTPFTTAIVLALLLSSLLILFKVELLSPLSLSFCFYCIISTTQPPIQTNQQI